MLSGTFASTANQVSRNRKDSEHVSAGFEPSGHFKGYLFSLESLLVFFLRKKLTAYHQIVLRITTFIFLCIPSLPFQQGSFGFLCSWISFMQLSKKEEIRHKCITRPSDFQAALSTSNLDHWLKDSTCFEFNSVHLKTILLQLQSLPPARQGKKMV